MKIAVVGLGAAGLATTLAAAEAGHEVVGFEQSDLDNQEASSGGRGKIIRFGYDDPFFADLMRSTMTRWEDLERRTGTRLMDRNGGLHIGSPDAIAVVANGISDAGQGYEDLSASSRRLADFGAKLGDIEPAVFEPAAGVMWTSAVRSALASRAVAAGADLRAHTRVEDIDLFATGVGVGTSAGVSLYDHVVVSGGPWAFRLAPEVADVFAITRRFQLVFATDEPLGDGLPRPWIDLSEPGFYGMINVADRTHLIGIHELDREQMVRDPDEPVDEAIRESVVRQEIDYVRSRFGVVARPVDVRVCHYTSTLTRDFIIDDCPGLPGATLLSACSGHGFKFSITMGAYAAALVTGRTVPDRERFRL
jgi:glycine/D-amino acid oxidase-like deaminating enzyme